MAVAVMGTVVVVVVVSPRLSSLGHDTWLCGGGTACAQVQLFLNAGDHTHMRQAFVEALTAMGVTKYGVVDTMAGVPQDLHRDAAAMQPRCSQEMEPRSHAGHPEKISACGRDRPRSDPV